MAPLALDADTQIALLRQRLNEKLSDAKNPASQGEIDSILAQIEALGDAPAPSKSVPVHPTMSFSSSSSSNSTANMAAAAAAAAAAATATISTSSSSSSSLAPHAAFHRPVTAPHAAMSSKAMSIPEQLQLIAEREFKGWQYPAHPQIDNNLWAFYHKIMTNIFSNPANASLFQFGVAGSEHNRRLFLAYLLQKKLFPRENDATHNAERYIWVCFWQAESWLCGDHVAALYTVPAFGHLRRITGDFENQQGFGNLCGGYFYHQHMKGSVEQWERERKIGEITAYIANMGNIALQEQNIKQIIDSVPPYITAREAAYVAQRPASTAYTR